MPMVVMDVLDDLVHRCRVDGKAEYDHVGGLCGGLMRGCCLKQNSHFDVSRSKTFVAPTANKGMMMKRMDHPRFELFSGF